MPLCQAMPGPLRAGLLVALMLLAPGIANAQSDAERDVGAQVLIELNTAQTDAGACTLTFKIINGHDAPIASVIYETVLFTADGAVDRLTLFDFGSLPPARPRVRQFIVPDLACAGLGSVLINGAHSCVADTLPDTACEADLTLQSRIEIELLG